MRKLFVTEAFSDYYCDRQLILRPNGREYKLVTDKEMEIYIHIDNIDLLIEKGLLREEKEPPKIWTDEDMIEFGRCWYAAGGTYEQILSNFKLKKGITE